MAVRTGTPLPSLDGIELWLNGCQAFTPGSHTALIVHFWAMSCPACKAGMPDLHVLQKEFAPAGVHFIAVHSPRMPDDVNNERSRQIAADIGVTEPCALDNERVLADRFELGGLWPYYFLYDSEGCLKLRDAGGIGLRLVTNSLRRLVPLA